MTTILIGQRNSAVSDSNHKEIAQLAPDARIVISDDEAQIAQEVQTAEIITGIIPRPLIHQAKSLRWLQLWSAGADWLLDQPELQSRDFLVTTVSGIHAIGMSEHALALMLAFARQLPRAQAAQRERQWLRPELTPFELAGKTLLLIGIGAIGQRTALLATALAMRVIGIRRNPDRPAAKVDVVAGPSDLHRWLPEADFVLLTLPLTRESRHLIGAPELALMKPEAYLLNIGRGRTVDESALVLALEEGRVAGAGLDVFEREPLPPESPLWAMPNVILTPHYAGIVPDYHRRAMELFIENLRRYMAGEPLRNRVNRQLGY